MNQNERVDFLKVSRLVNDCPNCGNQYIGNGQESVLEVSDNIIKRFCKCGFKFKYDVNQGTSKKKLKQAIDNSLVQVRGDL